MLMGNVVRGSMWKQTYILVNEKEKFSWKIVSRLFSTVTATADIHFGTSFSTMLKPILEWPIAGVVLHRNFCFGLPLHIIWYPTFYPTSIVCPFVLNYSPIKVAMLATFLFSLISFTSPSFDLYNWICWDHLRG